MRLAALAFSLAMIVAATSIAQAPKKPRTAEQIQKDLDAAKKKVEELEAELSKLNPPKRYRALTYRSLTVGEVGIPSGALNIVRIIDDNKAIVIDEDSPKHPFILSGNSFKDEAEGKGFSLRETPWKVTKTEKVGGRTYFVIEPYTEPAAGKK